MGDLWVLMDAYRDMFGEPFPILMMYGMGDEAIIEELKKCIDTKTPYESDYDGVI